MGPAALTTSRVEAGAARPTASPGPAPWGRSMRPDSPTSKPAAPAGTKPGGRLSGVWGDAMNRGHRVLIVEDEPNVRLVFRTALESDDCRVTAAPDGENA